MKTFIATLTVCFLPFAAARADVDDWAEDCATRTIYNAGLPWKNPMGDWHDAKNVAQGDAPFATAVVSGQGGEWVEWDVTGLVKEWGAGTFPNQGFYLKAHGGGGNLTFVSRQGAEEGQRPKLIVETGEKTAELPVAADLTLVATTHNSAGLSPTLKISGGSQVTLVRFRLTDVKQVRRAALKLFLTERKGDKVTVSVFRCSQSHRLPPSDPIPGLAAKYPADRGIEKDPDVVFFTGFESENWQKEWTHIKGRLATVDADPEKGFEALQGKALRTMIQKGSTGAMSVRYEFKDKTGSEPEEIYFRYYLRFGTDWNQTVDGGKMPGLAGTYGKAGNGGSRSNGLNGWSARGRFGKSPQGENPMAGLHPIGTYCYHADMKGFFGDGWIWNDDYRGWLRTGRWYSVETYAKMNSIDGKEGRKDAILRGWVDGRLAFEKTDLRFRHVDTLKIEEVWMNVFHGGTVGAGADQHMYVDNVVVARKYIGPMGALERR